MKLFLHKILFDIFIFYVRTVTILFSSLFNYKLLNNNQIIHLLYDNNDFDILNAIWHTLNEEHQKE